VGSRNTEGEVEGGDDTTGIVNAEAGFDRFGLTRREPAADLAWAVERYWIVRWDLRGQAPYDQRIIPHPAVHLVFEDGTASIQAITPHEFVRHLDGRGQVIGVKFRPAGFRPFLGRAVSSIAGQRFEASALWGDGVDDLAHSLARADDLRQRTGAVEDLLRSTAVRPLPMTAAVNGIVDHIAADRSVTRVDDLAARLAISTRRLQRLFAEHVGLGPKWVINRFRIQQAAELASTSVPVDWARLAADLGYSDQAHLVRDFAAAVGSTPARYARQLTAVRAVRGSRGR
jgi:AraC-like DNA-binding protein